MKPKQRMKIMIDIFMTILLVVLMAYPVTGQLAHEWVGAGMFLLFIAHHVLNRRWFKTLGKGKYHALRVVQTVIDILLLLDMLALMFSGIRLSRYVFTFLPSLGSVALARQMHMLASYWGFVLMGLHLGFHWNIIIVVMFRHRSDKKTAGVLISRLISVSVSLYGAYAVWKHQIWTYLFLYNEFLVFDFSQSSVLYFLDYVCMMTLFALLTHEILSMWRKYKSNPGITKKT